MQWEWYPWRRPWISFDTRVARFLSIPAQKKQDNFFEETSFQQWEAKKQTTTQIRTEKGHTRWDKNPRRKVRHQHNLHGEALDLQPVEPTVKKMHEVSNKLHQLPGIETRGLSRALTAVSKRLVDDTAFNTFTMILTVYALFGDDLRLATTSEPADPIFDWITGIALVIFTILCHRLSTTTSRSTLQFQLVR